MTKKGEIHIRQIAERIREVRQAKGKTQNDLAVKLNISRAAFGEYERGNNLPPIDKLIIIAQELEVSIDYLAGIETANKTELREAHKLMQETARLISATMEKITESSGIE